MSYQLYFLPYEKKNTIMTVIKDCTFVRIFSKTVYVRISFLKSRYRYKYFRKMFIYATCSNA